MRQIENPLDIESNKQRQKTPSEVMREAKHPQHVYAERAKRAMLAGASAGGVTAGRGRPKSEDSPRATLHEGYGRTDAKVADAVGMKQRTFAKVKNVFESAADEKPVAPEVHERLTPMGVILPTTERQARPLAALPPEQQAPAWHEAVETAPNGRPTGAHVAATVARFVAPRRAERRRGAGRRTAHPRPILPADHGRSRRRAPGRRRGGGGGAV